MKKIRFKKEVKEGEKLPRFYGLAYTEYVIGKGFAEICYPIPFNFLIGWIKLAHYRLKTGPKKPYGLGFEQKDAADKKGN